MTIRLWESTSRFRDPATQTPRFHSERAQRRAVLGEAAQEQLGGEEVAGEAAAKRHRPRDQSARAHKHQQCAQIETRFVRPQIRVQRGRAGSVVRGESAFAGRPGDVGHERVDNQ